MRCDVADWPGLAGLGIGGIQAEILPAQHDDLFGAKAEVAATGNKQCRRGLMGILGSTAEREFNT